MLKHITVGIVVDDHEPEKCGECQYRQTDEGWCFLFHQLLSANNRCQQCMEEAK